MIGLVYFYLFIFLRFCYLLFNLVCFFFWLVFVLFRVFFKYQLFFLRHYILFYQTINSCLSLFCFARRIYYFHSILFTYFHYFLILRHYLLLYLNIASFIITVLLPSQFLKKLITHYDNVTLQRSDSSVFLASENQDQDLFFLAVSYLSFNISFDLLTNSLHSQVISVQTT